MTSSIRDLHAAFVRLTGQRIELNMLREQQWATWLGFRREAPFTVADLALVIDHLKAQIRAGDRKPAALKFSNLVCNPDYFEEDLEQARARARARPTPPRRVSTPAPDGSVVNRQVPGDPGADSSRRAGAVLESEAFKRFCKLKETL